MIFTLEALQAAHGDALLLHYGPADSAKLAVIDAGPLGIYKSSVRPRLEEIRARRSPDATLALDYVLVSHIDDDHIHGITDLTKELVGDPARVKQILCSSATDLGRERYFQGAGMLDVLRALQSM